eukprot:TRINITY_DN57779_c0_g1_i1.p1 TRINITY_DN57779_c0_g1~~TRINITY_DN57779_c0_g1_i1.p1  ORF type:complete len:278 (+),score=52.12 TRINITY_DN57779_c0_g1_i1:42-836(+)
MSQSGARTYKQGALANSFRRAPVSSTLQMITEAFPEIDHVQRVVSAQVAIFLRRPEDEEFEEFEAAGCLEADRSAAAWEVQQFCSTYPAMSVLPSPAELEDTWARCKKFQARSVATAIYDQLAHGWSRGERDWQPQLRALCLLELMRGQPGRAGAAGKALVAELSQLLEFLAREMPQFRSVACRLLGTKPCAFGDTVVDARAYAPVPDLCGVQRADSSESTEASESEYNVEVGVEQPLPSMPSAKSSRPARCSLRKEPDSLIDI